MINVDNLQDALQRDLAWRKREISDFRGLALRDEFALSCIFRAAQIMLCAHWEGFLKKGLDLYVIHAFSQDIRLKEMSPCMMSISYFKDVMEAAQADFPGSKNHHLRLAEKILNTFDDKVKPVAWKVNSYGNPGSSELAKMLASIGLDLQLGMDDALWSTTKIFIDEIVRDRNHIAHGEGLPIDQAVFLERASRLTSLMDLMVVQIMDAAMNKRYLKKLDV